jgi:hypothetical protein
VQEAVEPLLRRAPAVLRAAAAEAAEAEPSVRTHTLKTWPEPFQAVLDGRKKHEVRVDDRGFAVGDHLHLEEWVPGEARYTGQSVTVAVTYISRGPDWGLPERMVVMSLAWPILATVDVL